MKILQVVPYFHPAYAFGGPVKVVYQISRELVKRGHEVVVYTTDVKDFDSRLEMHSGNIVDGIKVDRFKNLSLMLVKKFKLFITPRLVSSAKEEVEKFDVVHLHEYRTFQNIVMAHYARKYGVPYVLQAHGSLPKIMAWQRLKRGYDVLFGHKLLRGASRVVALSSFEADQYRRMGVPEEKIAIIPNGLDLSAYANLPAKGCFKMKFGIPEEKKIILYLGRIHKTKGIDYLIKAYAHLTNKMGVKDTVLVIAGPDDGYLKEAKVLVKSLDLSNSVFFTGFISREDKLKALVDAEVFLSPSFYGFPMTFLEACVVGTPIVTTNLGDELEWIDGEVGFVAEPTPKELAKAIQAIVFEKELKRKFSRNCLNIVKEEFSMERVIDRFEKLYSGIIEANPQK